MAPYIFMERNGIHIIDLYKTSAKLEEAANALKNIAKSGKRVLFVATKKQAKDVTKERAMSVDMPYVIERWPGGMLTNFATIRKAVKKMDTIDKMETDGTMDNMSKREKLQLSRQRAKLGTACPAHCSWWTCSRSTSLLPRLTAWVSPCSVSWTPTATPAMWTL